MSYAHRPGVSSRQQGRRLGDGRDRRLHPAPAFREDPEVITKRINPDKSSYTNSYTTAAAFLIWIEAKKSRDIVPKLNLACHEGRYSVALFKEYTGQDVDALWKEFAESLRK